MNIEKTISEQAVSDILTPMLESQDRIVTEDVAPLFNDATGLGTPPASGTVATTIEESRSVISAIIRKAWTATLTMLCGASVIGYIAAAYTYLRNRLQGNETYGIPDRRSEISASSPLAANLALLNDRKISAGADIPDGLSIGRLIGTKVLTEVIDTSTPGWELEFSIDAVGCLQNVKKISLNCNAGLDSVNRRTIRNLNELEELELAYVEEIGNSSGNTIYHNLKLKRLDMRGTKRVYGYAIGACQALRYIRWGTLTTYNCNFNEQTLPDLIHLEFGADTACNINLSKWDATNALDASRTDLIEEGSTAQNNLQQFLSNFKTYIAERLADNGSGKTLTLSQAVFSEIWDSQGQPQVKGDGLDQLRADIHRIIRTDKQWAVNKA